MAAGAAPVFIALLGSEQAIVPQLAAGILQVLAMASEQNKDDSMAAGAVPVLVALLKSEQTAVQEPTAATL